MRNGSGLDGTTLYRGAAISFSGPIVAGLIALRTHAQAPVCGAEHCPACYVAAALATIGVVLATVGWNMNAAAAMSAPAAAAVERR